MENGTRPSKKQVLDPILESTLRLQVRVRAQLVEKPTILVPKIDMGRRAIASITFNNPVKLFHPKEGQDASGVERTGAAATPSDTLQSIRVCEAGTPAVSSTAGRIRGMQLQQTC